MILWLSDVIEDIVVFFQDVLITLLAGVYVVVSDFYQIFLVLARTNIFEQSTYQSLTEKVYVILAVVMLFVLAYNFITLIVDPDKNKGGKVMEDIIKNAVTSLILIVLCPTLFTIAFDLQDAVLNQGIISKFFTVDGGYDASGSITTGGRLMAGTTFSAFFTPNAGVDPAEVDNESGTKIYVGEHKVIDASGKEVSKTEKLDCSSEGNCTLEQAIDFATITGDFMVFHAFAKNLTGYSDPNNSLDLNFLLSLVAGGFLIFTIASFCFDLALRVIKLAFYQIISPICIAFRVVPGKDGIFKNWWRAVTKTFLSVFVRIFIMNLAIFLLVSLKEASFWEVACPDCSFRVNLLAYAFLVMGLLMFIKQSTKLIDEIFGLGDINMGIGALREQMKSNGAFAAGAAIGAGAKGMAHGLTSGVSAFKATKGQKWNKRVGAGLGIGAKTVGRGVGSTLRSLSASTGGFGFGGFKDEFASMRANKDAAVQGADLGALALKDKIETGKQMLHEAKDLKLIQARIKEKLDHKRQLEQEALYKAAMKAKIKLDEINAEIEEDNKTMQRMTDQITLSQEKLQRLIDSGASEKEIGKVRKTIQSQQEALDKFREKAHERQLKQAECVTALSNADTALSSAKGMNLDEYQAQIDAINKEVSSIVEERAEFKTAQVYEDFATKTAQKWTGVDQSRAQDLVMQYNDKIKDATKKIINKYGSKITVDMATSLKKNAAFADNFSAVAQAIQDKGFTVADLTGMAQRLSMAQSEQQVRQILGDDVANSMNIDASNWAQVSSAFINVVQEPYTKEVNKAVTDAITSGNEGFEYEVVRKDADGHDVKTKSSVFAADAHTIMTDLDAQDVSRKKYAYDVLHFELYGTAAPTTSAGRKALEDELRKRNAANDRAKAGKQVMGDVRSANTTGNSGKK